MWIKFGDTALTFVLADITCDALNVVENATEVNNTGSAFGAIVKYDCYPGHKFPDMERSKTLVCLKDGWTEGGVKAQLPLKACERMY